MMALEERLRSYEPLFGGWTLQGEIGTGSYARVYRVVHRDPFGMVLESALKVIEIIPEGKMENASNLEALVREQYINEVNLLGQLRGISNIVSYEDHAIQEIRDQGELIGYDLLIRMELLTSLEASLRQNGNNIQKEEGIRKIGMDLCRGLSRCHRVGILHRDIKPKNIFVNRFGDYKLGDFGIAHHLEGTVYARTRIGTELYAAPEITDRMSSKYDARADLYSLGLVLYQLSNHGYLPFITAEMPRSRWKAEAIDRRNRGEELPLPAGVSKAFAEVIRKACAYLPAERYGNAQEMYHALQFSGKSVVKPAAAHSALTEEPNTLTTRFWKQWGLCVVPSSDAEYMKAKLQEAAEKDSAPEKKVHEMLSLERAQKLPSWFSRMKNSGNSVLHIDNYRKIGNWAFRGRKDISSVSCSAEVRTIGEEAFADCSALQALSLNEPLQTIDNAAFLRCTKLVQCILPESLESIGERAFADCLALQTVRLPSKVTELPPKLFFGCHMLREVQIPEGLLRIGAEAFFSCTAIRRFTVPNQVNWMGPRTFADCKAMQEISLSSSLQAVPQGCFQDCVGLRSVHFSYGLRYIEERAFYHCAELHSLELPFGLEKIGAGAFAGCDNLTFLRVPDSVVSIGEQAFGMGGNRLLRSWSSKILVETSRGSYVWDYCKQNGIRVQEAQK